LALAAIFERDLQLVDRPWSITTRDYRHEDGTDFADRRRWLPPTLGLMMLALLAPPGIARAERIELPTIDVDCGVSADGGV
jgi:hypothetical protein